VTSERANGEVLRLFAGPDPASDDQPPEQVWSSPHTAQRCSNRDAVVLYVGSPLPPAAEDVPREVNEIQVQAATPEWLRRMIGDPSAAIITRDVEIVVNQWSMPFSGWSGRPGPLRGLLRFSVEYPGKDPGAVRIHLQSAWPSPLRAFLMAALSALMPLSRLPAAASPDITADYPLPTWLAGHLHVTPASERVTGRSDVRDHDLILLQDPREAASVPAESTKMCAVLEEHGNAVHLSDRRWLVIDTTTANPTGRVGPYRPSSPPTTLELSHETDPPREWRIRDSSGKVVVAGRLGLSLLDDDVARLLRIRAVEVTDWPSTTSQSAVAALVAQLAATGLLCTFRNIPPSVSELLTPELTTIISDVLPADSDEELVWELRSIRQRRAALRGHGSRFVLRRETCRHVIGSEAVPAVSIVLVSSRPEFLPHALALVDRQTYPRLELVLGLHGDKASKAEISALLQDRAMPTQLVRLPSVLSFGEALAEATEHASGSFVTKFDDDDWYGPEHVWDLILAYDYSGATLVGKAAEFVYLRDINTTVRRTGFPGEQYARTVTGAALLLTRGDLESIGGWRPLGRAEDKTLLERVIALGGLVYRTHGLGLLLHRRRSGHTWDPGLGYFLRNSGTQWRGLLKLPEFGTDAAALRHSEAILR
jgi:hypothetical protein